MRTVGVAPVLAAIPLVHHYLVAAIALALKMKIFIDNSQIQYFCAEATHFPWSAIIYFEKVKWGLHSRLAILAKTSGGKRMIHKSPLI